MFYLEVNCFRQIDVAIVNWGISWVAVDGGVGIVDTSEEVLGEGKVDACWHQAFGGFSW
jgi:hypothetical protein